MAYRFRRDDRSVQKGVARIAREQITSMLRVIDSSSEDTGNAVHALRKSCKKVRGLLRLVRPVFSDYSEENAAFRDIAATVSVVRDAAVLSASYDAVMALCDGEMGRPAVASIRRELILRGKRLAATGEPIELLQQAREPLLRAAQRVEHWTLDGDGFESLQGGLRKTYRQAQKAMRKAEQHPLSTQFHEWRKHCKYHGYHARLLQPVWPGPMKAYAACAYELADLLGNHHDLAVLLETITEEPSAFGTPSDVELMLSVVRQRQAALERQSFAQGKRLLADSPKALVSSWGARYELWHHQKPAHSAVPRHTGPR